MVQNCQQASRTHIESISSIEVECDMILAKMKKVKIDATAPLEKLSTTCDMMMKEPYLESLSEVKKLDDSQLDLGLVAYKHNELYKELDLLEKHKQDICAFIRHDEEELKKLHIISSSKKEEVVAMENAPFQSDEVVQNLEASREILATRVALCENVTKLDDSILSSSSSFGLLSTIMYNLAFTTLSQFTRRFHNLIPELLNNFIFYFFEEELEETSTFKSKTSLNLGNFGNGECFKTSILLLDGILVFPFP
ncbi:hypothetical protein M9H77_34820 [Catharanthus roseus]|uniref:Uncharacterized protein n=1 Tax=Catharanthus roseus TaxID=4058 RepID=A0ACB9ZMI3_CATRO|nr:hypothetical protein M9H77_34820 [Catharanthus roseus]